MYTWRHKYLRPGSLITWALMDFPFEWWELALSSLFAGEAKLIAPNLASQLKCGHLPQQLAVQPSVGMFSQGHLTREDPMDPVAGRWGYTSKWGGVPWLQLGITCPVGILRDWLEVGRLVGYTLHITLPFVEVTAITEWNLGTFMCTTCQSRSLSRGCWRHVKTSVRPRWSKV